MRMQIKQHLLADKPSYTHNDDRGADSRRLLCVSREGRYDLDSSHSCFLACCFYIDLRWICRLFGRLCLKCNLVQLFIVPRSIALIDLHVKSIADINLISRNELMFATQLSTLYTS